MHRFHVIRQPPFRHLLGGFLAPFRRVIIAQFVEWIGIAVIGGAIVGTLSAFLFNRLSQRRRPRQTPGADR